MATAARSPLWDPRPRVSLTHYLMGLREHPNPRPHPTLLLKSQLPLADSQQKAALAQPPSVNHVTAKPSVQQPNRWRGLSSNPPAFEFVECSARGIHWISSSCSANCLSYCWRTLSSSWTFSEALEFLTAVALPPAEVSEVPMDELPSFSANVTLQTQSKRQNPAHRWQLIRRAVVCQMHRRRGRGSETPSSCAHLYLSQMATTREAGVFKKNPHKCVAMHQTTCNRLQPPSVTPQLIAIGRRMQQLLCNCTCTFTREGRLGIGIHNPKQYLCVWHAAGPLCCLWPSGHCCPLALWNGVWSAGKPVQEGNGGAGRTG